MTRPRVVSRVRWRDRWHPGTSSAVLSELEGGWRLTGRADVRFAEGPSTFRFRVDCTPHWDVRSAEIALTLGRHSRRCFIESNGRREWRIGGIRNRSLDGCTDFDLAATPATNLLTLRRLALSVGETAEILTAWVLFPDIEVQAVRQRYTRLEDRRYRFEALNNNFTAEFDVDESLMVTTYGTDYEPIQWRRTTPKRRPPPKGGASTLK